MSTSQTTTPNQVGGRYRDLVTGVIGIWLVAAVLSDGWAHYNVPDLESFFTPWHGALYAGLAVMTGWVAFLAWRTRTAGRPVLSELPRGYAGAAIGVLLFGAGGVADLLWHEIFGIEVAVDALVSPSHLLLGAGGLLMLSSPLRAQGVLHTPASWSPAAMLSLVLSTALVAFFLLYTSPFSMPGAVTPYVPAPEKTSDHFGAELPVVAGLAGYLVATMVFTVPLLLTLRNRTAAVPGAATALVGAVAFLSVAVVGFPGTALAGAVGATAGAAVADLALRRVLATWGGRSRWLLPIAAGGVAVLVWSGQLAGLAIADAVRWPASLWVGVVVLAGFAASAVALLAASPSGAPAEASVAGVPRRKIARS